MWNQAGGVIKARGLALPCLALHTHRKSSAVGDEVSFCHEWLGCWRCLIFLKGWIGFGLGMAPLTLVGKWYFAKSTCLWNRCDLYVGPTYGMSVNKASFWNIMLFGCRFSLLVSTPSLGCWLATSKDSDVLMWAVVIVLVCLSSEQL